MDYETLKAEQFPTLFENLFTNADTKVTPQGNIRINSEKVDHKNFSNWFLILCKEPSFKQYSNLLQVAPTPTVFFEDFRRGLKAFQVNIKYSSSRNLDVVKDFSYDNYIPFISIEDANKKMFYNKTNGEICELDYKTYELTMDRDFRRHPIRAIIEFNPYRPEQIYKAESKYGQECTHINTYKRPEWQLPRQLSFNEQQSLCTLPETIDRFMRHLFPSDSARNFAYDWLHFALTSRCETYLVLNGAKGVGKGIFTDHICKSLMGKGNHKLAPPGALDTNFNALLENCRMIVLDEFKIDEDDKINKLKRYINKDQMIEHKGVDVGKTISTYNSFIVSSNGLSDIKVYWDDRRFSVMDIATEKLDEKWSKAEIDDLIDSIEEENSDVMRNFGYWLLYRQPQGTEFSVFKGEHFYKLCYSSLAEWSRLLIDEITSGENEIIDDSTLKLAYKERNPTGRFPASHKVDDFLKNYKHEGKHYLGELVREGKSYHIKVNDEFITSSTDSTGLDFTNLLG